MNLEILRWIWRFCFAAYLISNFLSNIAVIQVGLLVAIIAIRVYIVHNDKTVY